MPEMKAETAAKRKARMFVAMSYDLAA